MSATREQLESELQRVEASKYLILEELGHIKERIKQIQSAITKIGDYVDHTIEIVERLEKCLEEA